MKQMGNEVSAAVAKTTPALTVAAASVGGWGVQEWMYAATLCYVVMQGAYLIWKWNRERKASIAFAEKMAEPLE